MINSTSYFRAYKNDERTPRQLHNFYHGANFYRQFHLPQGEMRVLVQPAQIHQLSTGNLLTNLSPNPLACNSILRCLQNSNHHRRLKHQKCHEWPSATIEKRQGVPHYSLILKNVFTDGRETLIFHGLISPDTPSQNS